MGAILRRQAIAALFERFGPVVHMRDARAAGIGTALVIGLESRGELVRLGKAAFVTSAAWQCADPWEKFRLRSIAFAMCSAPDVYLTGWSTSAVLGMPTVCDPPETPTAIRPGNAHRGTDRSPHGRIRTGYLPESHRWRRSGARTVSPAYAALEIARHATPLDALVAVDHVLGSGVQPEQFNSLIHRMAAYPGIASAVWAVRHGDGRAESPLETMGRLAFIEAGARTAGIERVDRFWTTSGTGGSPHAGGRCRH